MFFLVLWYYKLYNRLNNNKCLTAFFLHYSKICSKRLVENKYTTDNVCLLLVCQGELVLKVFTLK